MWIQLLDFFLVLIMLYISIFLIEIIEDYLT